MVYVHFPRNRPFVFNPEHEYTSGGFGKPRGFWFSVEGDDHFGWKEWCEGEGFSTEALEYPHEVTLKPEANILYIDSVEKLIALDRSLPRDLQGEPEGTPHTKYMPVKWNEMYAVYDGIIIAPYQWSVRYDIGWYYGWDCASGCVWNLSMIESVLPMRMEVEADA